MNDVVSVNDNNIPRLLWRLERAIELITSKDDAVRDAIVQTILNSTGIRIKRDR